jgi:hypothetical protein
MSLRAAIGHASAIEGRKASAEAVRQALQHADGEKAALAFILASAEYPFNEVISGVAPVLGDTPLIGFSTTHELTPTGPSQRSVIIALLIGDSLQAQAIWLPGYAENREGPIAALANDLAAWDHEPGSLAFIAADGLGGDVENLAARLSQGVYTLAGCQAGGSVQKGQTYQVGGAEGGGGGLAAAWMNGLKAGVGFGHGWQPVGSYFQVTEADGQWVRALDDNPPAEAYARLFGFEPRDWSLPPLNELVRLYPLGLEVAGSADLQVRSPLRIEDDGSLRMSIPVPLGSTCHLLVGSLEGCITAAQAAAVDARSSLGSAQPLLALVLLDIAWKALFEAQPLRVLQALRAVLGPAVPIVGGFTHGQLARPENTAQVEVLNQHIVVLLIGEET